MKELYGQIMIRIYLMFILLLIVPSGFAQTGFEIEGNKKKFKLLFNPVNNLVVIPVELNGIHLSFLLDTGVDNSVLFKLPESDSVELRNTSSIWIKGMGLDKPVEGIRSQGNVMKIGKAVHNNFTFYTVFENHMELSRRMGLPIHGIIGNDFFRDFIVEIKYLKNKIKVYDPDFYRRKKCRRCEELSLKFYKNKPYITLNGKINEETIALNLLIDSGSGDALWLFEKPDKIRLPEKSFPDFLGHGFGGSVYGSKSRIRELDFGKFRLREITASFPDSTFTEDEENFIHRDGIIGAQILNKFNVILDYRGEKILLKPNRKFSEPFNYDMSGIAIAHSGYTVVKEYSIKTAVYDSDKKNEEISYLLKPEYEIVEIRPQSPAELSGLQVGDIIKRINGKSAHYLSLEEIIAIFSSEDGKRIKLIIERNGEEIIIAFVLKRML